MMYLLAQFTTLNKKEAFQQFSRQFQETDPLLWVKTVAVLVLLTIAVILVCVLVRLQRRGDTEQGKPRPMRLFLSSLIRMKVPLLDIVQLWCLTRRLRIAHPTALLISAVLFDDAVNRYCTDSHGRILRRRSHGRLSAMRATLFGTHAH